MGTYYFPACGFGFWYLLGKWQAMSKTDTDVYIGSSAGSLVCVCSLISHPQLFDVVIGSALETFSRYKRATRGLNLHTLVSLFLDELERHIDATRVQKHLAQIRIQLTEIKGFTMRRHQIQPTSWHHLRELCMASCYIPIISNCNYRLCYIVDGMACIDGAFADLYAPNRWQTFDVSPHRGLSFPSLKQATRMYLIGLYESDDTSLVVFRMLNPFYIACMVTFLCVGYVASTMRC